MAYAWNWQALENHVPFDDFTYLEWLETGLWATIYISLAAWCIALSLGTLAGIARVWPHSWIRNSARVYIEVFRNIPLLVQLFVWYFAVPELLPEPLASSYKESDPATQQYLAVIAGLGLFTSARLAEHIRAGLESLSQGQKNAALALGFSLAQAYRYVLLPMAFRVVLPTLGSELLNTFKNSAACSTIGLIELSYQAGQLAECNDICLPYESFILITLAYLALNTLAMAAVRSLEKRLRIPGFIGGK